MRDRIRRAAMLAVVTVTLLGLSSNVLWVQGAPTQKPVSTGKEVSKVNINTADTKQLQVLPGVGEVMARRIIEFREKNGPFKRIEDLLAVRGIGEKLLERLRDQVVL